MPAIVEQHNTLKGFRSQIQLLGENSLFKDAENRGKITTGCREVQIKEMSNNNKRDLSNNSCPQNQLLLVI